MFESLDTSEYRFISYYNKYDIDLKPLSSVILEYINGDYFYIEDDKDKISDVVNMPYYIRDDWFKYNRKSLSIKTLNEHIKEWSNQHLLVDNNDIDRILNELKLIRRDLIIKGII
jgi:hypothetical protein